LRKSARSGSFATSSARGGGGAAAADLRGMSLRIDVHDADAVVWEPVSPSAARRFSLRWMNRSFSWRSQTKISSGEARIRSSARAPRRTRRRASRPRSARRAIARVRGRVAERRARLRGRVRERKAVGAQSVVTCLWTLHVRVHVHVLAHTLWELDRTGVKASILTDCVGQLRLIESTQPPIEFPQGMGEYARPYTWGFCHRLPYAGRRHSSRVSSFKGRSLR
jgi:hypothetical protein